VRAVIPRHLERITPFERGPGVAREDCDPAQGLKGGWQRCAVDGHDLLDAGDLHRGVGIGGGELVSEHRMVAVGIEAFDRDYRAARLRRSTPDLHRAKANVSGKLRKLSHPDRENTPLS
jgi:hypothetical protein